MPPIGGRVSAVDDRHAVRGSGFPFPYLERILSSLHGPSTDYTPINAGILPLKMP